MLLRYLSIIVMATITVAIVTADDHSDHEHHDHEHKCEGKEEPGWMIDVEKATQDGRLRANHSDSDHDTVSSCLEGCCEHSHHGESCDTIVFDGKSCLHLECDKDSCTWLQTSDNFVRVHVIHEDNANDVTSDDHEHDADHKKTAMQKDNGEKLLPINLTLLILIVALSYRIL